MANVLANPRVAVIVADNSPFGLFAQGEGRVTFVEGEAAKSVRAGLLAKAPEIEPFFAAPLREARIVIDRWLLTDVPKGWLPAKELRASR